MSTETGVATSVPSSLPKDNTTFTVGTMTEIVTYTNPRKLKRMPRDTTKVEKRDIIIISDNKLVRNATRKAATEIGWPIIQEAWLTKWDVSQQGIRKCLDQSTQDTILLINWGLHTTRRTNKQRGQQRKHQHKTSKRSNSKWHYTTRSS